MAEEIITPVDELPPIKPLTLTSAQALRLGALACAYLLTGSPPVATFDPDSLILAYALLNQMAATLRPVKLTPAVIAKAGRS